MWAEPAQVHLSRPVTLPVLFLQVSPANGEARPCPAAPRSPLGGSPAKEELQTVPVFHRAPLPDLPAAGTKAPQTAPQTAPQACTLPQRYTHCPRAKQYRPVRIRISAVS